MTMEWYENEVRQLREEVDRLREHNKRIAEQTRKEAWAEIILLRALDADKVNAIRELMENRVWCEIPFPLRTRLRSAAESCRIACQEGDASRETPGNQAPTD
jgi:hypothetical protein